MTTEIAIFICISGIIRMRRQETICNICHRHHFVPIRVLLRLLLRPLLPRVAGEHGLVLVVVVVLVLVEVALGHLDVVCSVLLLRRSLL